MRDSLHAALASLVVLHLVHAVVAGEGTKEEPDNQNGKGPVFVMLCLKDEALPEAKSLEAAYKKWFQRPEEADGKVEWAENRKTVTFTLGGNAAVAGVIPRPIPKKDIEHACSNAFLWPDAWKELKDHKAYLIIIATGEFKERYDRSLFLSRAAAACSEAFSVTGIYWSDASTVHSPQMFRKQVVAKVSKSTDLPTFLWIGFLREKHDDGTFSLYTRGLASFGCMELEIVRSKQDPVDVLGLVHDVAQYLIHTGNVIKDGDTVGPTATMKIRTKHAPSAIDRKEKVIRIEY